MKIAALSLRLLAAATLLSTAAVQAQDAPPVRIRGQIVAVDATSLTVHRRAGDDVKIAITPEQSVGAVKALKLDDIAKGSYIGAATETTPDGKLVAVEVLVFPEAGRGSGEGHYAWDLMPGAMMTNANVDTVASSVKGRMLTLSYKGGTKEILVPENVPVVTPTTATRADLTVGKRVFIIASGASSNYKAARVIVEKDGVAPPM